MEEALSQFADLLEDPELDRSGGDAIYRGLGRGEYRERRSLDALLAAYRLGARVSWRRVSEIAIEARVDRVTLALLAESVFAYIDELSALSAEGYAQEQSTAAGETERRRRRLATLLLEPASAQADVRAAAGEAGWRIPPIVAALTWRSGGSGRRLRRGLPPEALIADPGDEDEPGMAVLSDPDAPGLEARLRRLAEGENATIVVGPAVEPVAAALSADRASAVLRLIEAGAVPASSVSRADEHLGALIAHGDERILDDLAAQRLEPLDGETTASRERLGRTLRAWLDHHGEVARIAEELHVHPQTVRYRMARLRELFGPRLDEPEARFELALALRGGVSSSSQREPSRQPN